MNPRLRQYQCDIADDKVGIGYTMNLDTDANLDFVSKNINYPEMLAHVKNVTRWQSRISQCH